MRGTEGSVKTLEGEIQLNGRPIYQRLMHRFTSASAQIDQLGCFRSNRQISLQKKMHERSLFVFFPLVVLVFRLLFDRQNAER
jgi:hypothetical protein